MDSKGGQRFATELWDGFELLSRNSASEIQFVKDVLKFFKRRVQLEDEYSKGLNKLCQRKEYSSSRGTVAKSWEDVLVHASNMSGVHGRSSAQISEKVVEALQVLIKDLENSRKQLVAEGTALNNEHNGHLDQLKKCKANYEKTSKEAEIAQKTYDMTKSDPAAKSKDTSKLEKEAVKKNQLAQQADEVYKKKVDEVNNFLDGYYADSMPKILNEFEHLETVRIHMLKANLKKYISVLEGVPSEVEKEGASLVQSVDKINVDTDIDILVRQNLTGKEIPDPFEYEQYVEGNVQGKKVKTGPKISFRRKVSGKSPEEERAVKPSTEPPATAVFGVSLENVMEKQRDQHPELDIPRVLPVLVETIQKMDGVKTEGIFRVPAPVSEIKSIKEKLDSGDYEVMKYTDNVLTPCALLKLWFRDIPEGIVPESLYESCTESPQRALEVLEQLSPLSQKVIKFIIHFLQGLVPYADVTLMNAENLAMVFAPSFLRCPYQDYNKAAAAADKEKAFVLELINSLPRGEGVEPKASVDPPVVLPHPLADAPLPAPVEAPLVAALPSPLIVDEDFPPEYSSLESPAPLSPQLQAKAAAPRKQVQIGFKPAAVPTTTGAPTGPVKAVGPAGKVSVSPALKAVGFPAAKGTVVPNSKPVTTEDTPNKKPSWVANRGIRNSAPMTKEASEARKSLPPLPPKPQQ